MTDTDKTYPRLGFYGGTGTVTGANFFLEVEHARILVDCGLTQGADFCDGCNYHPFEYDPATIDALIVTHAHLDHVGRIPRLVHKGFQGPIYSTPNTKKLARLILEDGARLMSREAEKNGRDPLYTQAHVEEAFERWETRTYHESFTLSGGYHVEFKDAGHILGSAMVEITLDETTKETIVFTGDLGNSPAPLLRDTEKITGATYMVMESVYGDRNHETRDDRRAQLEEILERTIERKGVLMIPAFSIERTQVLLSEINALVENKEIPEVPVFLDSPLAINVTEVYRDATQNFNTDAQDLIRSGDDLFAFKGLKMTRTREESKFINNVPPPKIIIAGAGMSHGGRIIHHEKRYLSDPNNTLLLVGYQVAGSLGRKLQDGIKEVEIYGEKVPVRAHIETLLSYSAHKGSDDLLEFVHGSSETLKKVFVAMGEPKSSQFLAQRIRDYLGIEAIAPKKGNVFDLD